MAFDPDLLELMPHQVLVYARASAGGNGYGAESFSTTASTYRGRVYPHSQEVTTDDGQVVQSNYVAWLRSTAALTVHHRYRLPAAVVSTSGPQPIPVKVDRPPDEDGQHHVKVFFGFASRGGQ